MLAAGLYGLHLYRSPYEVIRLMTWPVLGIGFIPFATRCTVYVGRHWFGEDEVQNRPADAEVPPPHALPRPAPVNHTALLEVSKALRVVIATREDPFDDFHRDFRSFLGGEFSLDAMMRKYNQFSGKNFHGWLVAMKTTFFQTELKEIWVNAFLEDFTLKNWFVDGFRISIDKLKKEFGELLNGQISSATLSEQTGIPKNQLDDSETDSRAFIILKFNVDRKRYEEALSTFYDSDRSGCERFATAWGIERKENLKKSVEELFPERFTQIRARFCKSATKAYKRFRIVEAEESFTLASSRTNLKPVKGNEELDAILNALRCINNHQRHRYSGDPQFELILDQIAKQLIEASTVKARLDLDLRERNDTRNNGHLDIEDALREFLLNLLPEGRQGTFKHPHTLQFLKALNPILERKNITNQKQLLEVLSAIFHFHGAQHVPELRKIRGEKEDRTIERFGMPQLEALARKLKVKLPEDEGLRECPNNYDPRLWGFVSKVHFVVQAAMGVGPQERHNRSHAALIAAERAFFRSDQLDRGGPP